MFSGLIETQGQKNENGTPILAKALGVKGNVVGGVTGRGLCKRSGDGGIFMTKLRGGGKHLKLFVLAKWV